MRWLKRVYFDDDLISSTYIKHVQALSKRAFDGITNVRYKIEGKFAFQFVPLEAINMETKKAEKMRLPLFLAAPGSLKSMVKMGQTAVRCRCFKMADIIHEIREAQARATKHDPL